MSAPAGSTADWAVLAGPASAGHGVHPRRVYCPIESAHQDRRVAVDARAGRFTYAGVKLDLGTTPAWVDGGLSTDEEWRIEWSKFYFGLDLAAAFSATGDESYLRAWLDLVTSWIAQVPVDHDPTDVIGRRLQNWVYAWQTFDSAPGAAPLPADFEHALLTSIRDQLDYLQAHLAPERNHRTLELYAVLVVTLALPSLDPGCVHRDSALAALHENLLTDVRADGVHRERSTHYHSIALRSFLAARLNATMFGLEVPAGYDERLAAALRFAMHVHRPDGEIPALSDSDSGSYLDLLVLGGQVLGEPELTYVGTRGCRGIAPAARNVSFPEGGYHVQRSGWGDRGARMADERFLVLGCGPLGDGGHGHYDALSVEAYAHGVPLVVDPGRYTYSEAAPNWRRWFKGTAAHNTVTVDGLDQTPYRRGKPKGPVARGTLLARHSTQGLDLLYGEVRSPAYDAVHRRAVMFVDDEYWLVFDQLRAATSHEYVARWHLLAGEQPVVSSLPGSRTAVTTPTMTLAAAGGAGARIESGWVSKRYGIKDAAPVIVVPLLDTTDADLVTLLHPRRRGQLQTPDVQLVDGSSGHQAVVDCAAGRCRDLVSWHQPELAISGGGLAVAGDVVWLRSDGDGRLDKVLVHQPTALHWSGTGPEPALQPAGDGWYSWNRAEAASR
ncbi:MAG: hypothetical protein QOE19_2401 [Actinomycetota bacterium]|nr:hypothetical protein [Actinomycetota bacterium]